ncbi:hypothetical protein Aperf_G00000036225 [Anoplocephala perfoliata]
MLCFGCTLFSEKLNLIDSNGRREPFFVVKRIGQGGFSVIDLVKSHQNSSYLYAIKRIRCFSDADREKALNEGKIHSNIPKHENLLPCFSVTERQLIPSPSNQGAISEVILLLPRYKNGTLQSFLEHRKLEGRSLASDEIHFFACGIAKGLQMLHSIGLAHRDLKPANVLISSNLVPVLMDFGSTTELSLQPMSYKEALRWEDFFGENCSLAYRAPEMFNLTEFSVVSGAADMWSFGCLLYALCFYESPFDQVYVNGDSIALAVASANFQFPTDWSVELLEKSPGLRPSADMVIEALKTIPNGKANEQTA